MQHVGEKMGVFTLKSLQLTDHLLPAFLPSISAFFWSLTISLQSEQSAYFLWTTHLECMNNIFF